MPDDTPICQSHLITPTSDHQCQLWAGHHTAFVPHTYIDNDIRCYMTWTDEDAAKTLEYTRKEDPNA